MDGMEILAAGIMGLGGLLTVFTWLTSRSFDGHYPKDSIKQPVKTPEL